MPTMNRALDILDNTRGWRWTDASELAWRAALRLLIAFKSRYGHCRVPTQYKSPCGFTLGAWLRSLRYSFQRGTLPQERLEAIRRVDRRALEPVYLLPAAKLAVLRSYVKLHKKQPSNDTVFKGFKLGLWVANKRSSYKSGTLHKDLVRALEDVPGWVWRVVMPGEALLQAVSVKARRDPSVWTGRGNFTAGERAFIAHARWGIRRGTLNKSVARALRKLPGWTDSPMADRWTRRYNELKSLSRNAVVTPVFNPASLRHWVYEQRRLYQGGRLSVQKRRLLEQLGWWKSYMQRSDGRRAEQSVLWLRSYARLKQALARNVMRSLASAHGSKRYGSTCQFIWRMRRLYRNSQLSTKVVQLMEQLPGWEWRGDNETEDGQVCRGLNMFRRLKAALVVSSFDDLQIENGPLWHFVKRARDAKKRKTIDRLLASMLESLPGWTWAIKFTRPGYARRNERLWNKRYTRLVNGSPMKRTKRDISWMAHQRLLATNKKVSEHRLKLLGELPDWDLEASRCKTRLWLKNYALAVKACRAAGGIPPHRGRSLDRWLALQRRLARSGKMLSSRLRLLRKLLGWHTLPLVGGVKCSLSAA